MSEGFFDALSERDASREYCLVRENIIVCVSEVENINVL